MARGRRVVLGVLVGAVVISGVGVSSSLTTPGPGFQQTTEALPPTGSSASTAAPTATPSPVVESTPAPSPTESATAQGSSEAPPQRSAALRTTAAAAVVQTSSVRQDFSSPTRVNRVVVSVPAGAVASGSLTFSDGSRLLVTPDTAGDATVVFPERSVTWAALSLHRADGGAVSAAVDVWNVGYVGSSPTNTLSSSMQTTAAWTSSNGGGPGAAVLLDGNPATGSMGNEWSPNPTDVNPTVALSWTAPQEIASVQIVGPSSTAFDPAYAQAAELFGELVFDDGSVVPVAGVDAGEGQPTTVAFTPRMTTSVELRLHPTITQATAGLREFRAYPRGITPPRWNSGVTAQGRAVTPVSAGACSTASTPVGSTSDGSMALVCPAVGASVGTSATVVVRASSGAAVEGSAWVVDGAGAGSLQVVATATADSAGRATLTFPTASIMRGPFALKVLNRSATTADGRSPLYVQLYNAGGRVPASATSFAPAGMTLQWNEDFTSPLAVTQSGSGAVYAATKPAYWGNSEFGEAYFNDPAEGRDTLATLAGDYLRIRAQPISKTDPWGWSRQHESGLLSSMKVGATGFSAQYGYYEARVLGGAGRGTWPAFWMLDADSATKRSASTQGEVDAFELYGHDAMASCHGVHSWLNGRDVSSDVQCLYPNGASDWASSWHTYGVQMKPGGADYYIDGRLVKSLGNYFNSSDPFYFMLNLSLGGGYPIKIGGTGNTVDMYVDWVRVYT